MKNILWKIISKLPILNKVYYSRETQTPIRLKHLIRHKFLKKYKRIPWPVSHNSHVAYPERIAIGIDVAPGYMKGCYIQGANGIKIGDYSQIAPNVGIISRNHDLNDVRKYIDCEEEFSVEIGSYCWIGMGSVILPNVKLGSHCIIGAGSVVTKSFPNYSVIAGNPARVIKTLDENEVVKYENKYKFVGFQRIV